MAATTVAVLIPAAFPRLAFAENDVLAPIHLLDDALIRAMKAGSFSQRSDILAPVIDQTFDLTIILRESVGSFAWDSMAADQRANLMAAFKRYTVASYASSFDSFDGQRFAINPEPRSVGNDQVVRTQIIPVSGDSHTLDYVMHETPAGWRIVDVLADGAVSRVAVQRSDFRQLIRGGGATALVQSLQAKAASLSG